MLPRPVLGSNGLTAQAWSAWYERHGAPQLSRRFQRKAARAMGSYDWATWMAARAAAETASAGPRAPFAQQLRDLKQGKLAFDGYKGQRRPSAPGTVSCASRCCWRTATASPTSRPLEGFLHPTHRARHPGVRRARDRVQGGMKPAHALRALRAVAGRELHSFVRQPGRLASALVRPLLWLLVFAAGFQNVFGVAIAPPYETYIEYRVYLLPGLLGMVALFNGMQSSLAMVYDREMGVMRLLLTAPLPRWWILACKLLGGAALSLAQMIAFLVAAWLFGIELDPRHLLLALPVFLLAALMLGALGLVLSVYVKQLENFAGTMNFVIFPMFFLSTALYPAVEAAGVRRLDRARHRPLQPLHACGGGHALRAVRPVAGREPGGRGRLRRRLLPAGALGLRPAAWSAAARATRSGLTAGLSQHAMAVPF